ncbi:3'(2'),5'-bisphosphate nucleotidase CysQ [Amphritea sp. 2_MG-2023]|uniref:3'(2'),5'-bisphosphate nucleotidase CysQ n=1 Tax=Amphritea TaxID=515417 RepID=UPI001C06DE77|nr:MULTISPECIES: 3'(2'),5'-bisphosphate nucleotidase CysQ [Amphritea]MBU2964339.1 3'(2'),5'-bisphosphate nucleotidase CysQ [Amphritea atlantica]MDO6419701.1 3'(2'),5'-bisphosphate nucleotidase CysQ [Amphritea sp. 2_MG-2023]
MFNNQDIIALAKQAGAAIMEIYQRGFEISEKSDASPLTEADLASHHCIVDGLKQLTPEIPVLSEESSADEHQGRMSWNTYWLIDPLDGTKEFIKKNGEFTVNIALIDQGKAVFGVVYAPALGVTYWGDAEGAFKEEEGLVEPIHVSEIPGDADVWRVVGSRSHQSDEFKAFVQGLPQTEVVSMGSSLKLCLVAEGAADLYPRLGLTSEWDTAAAHAVVTAAGGQVLQYPELTPLLYNTRPDTLLNPFFIVCANKDDSWA